MLPHIYMPDGEGDHRNSRPTAPTPRPATSVRHLWLAAPQSHQSEEPRAGTLTDFRLLSLALSVDGELGA